ncbi:MAG: hypothetical protein QM817_41935 [Archangium sp.]
MKMFANQRGSAGIGSIMGVALVMALSLFGTIMLVKVYREGGASQLPENGRCQVVCAQGVVKARG